MINCAHLGMSLILYMTSDQLCQFGNEFKSIQSVGPYAKRNILLFSYLEHVSILGSLYCIWKMGRKLISTIFTQMWVSTFKNSVNTGYTVWCGVVTAF